MHLKFAIVLVGTPVGAGDLALVYKRDADGGVTWSNLSVLHKLAGFD